VLIEGLPESRLRRLVDHRGAENLNDLVARIREITVLFLTGIVGITLVFQGEFDLL
jgi:hypothetical protein